MISVHPFSSRAARRARAVAVGFGAPAHDAPRAVVAAFSALALFAGLAACNPYANIQRRAEHDLRCSDVVLKDVGAGGWEASGCGKKLSYVCSRGTNEDWMCVRDESSGAPRAILDREPRREAPRGKPRNPPARAATPAVAPMPLGLFSRDAALEALRTATEFAGECLPPGAAVLEGKIRVVFEPDGSTSDAELLEGATQDAERDACVVRAFRMATVPAFRGEPVSVARSFIAVRPADSTDGDGSASR
jgi:hypothetical protein